MSTTAVVWLVVGLLSITATVAMLIGLVRHVIVVGRAAARFQGELAEMAAEIADLGRGLARDWPGPAAGRRRSPAVRWRRPGRSPCRADRRTRCSTSALKSS